MPGKPDERKEVVDAAVSNDAITEAFLKAVDQGKIVLPEADVSIVRNGKTIPIRVRGLTDEEMAGLQERATFYRKDRRTGMTLPELNAHEYRSWLILTATLNVDFNNPQLLKEYHARTPLDLVSRMFLAGEKAAIVEKIEDLSGFQSERVDQAKN